MHSDVNYHEKGVLIIQSPHKGTVTEGTVRTVPIVRHKNIQINLVFYSICTIFAAESINNGDYGIKNDTITRRRSAIGKH